MIQQQGLIVMLEYMFAHANIVLRKNPRSKLRGNLFDYIVAGLPTVTTSINDAFDMIEKNKFGFLVSTAEDWYIAIKKLFINQTLYAVYKNNALKFAKNYDERKVLDPIFKKIL